MGLRGPGRLRTSLRAWSLARRRSGTSRTRLDLQGSEWETSPGVCLSASERNDGRDLEGTFTYELAGREGRPPRDILDTLKVIDENSPPEGRDDQRPAATLEHWAHVAPTATAARAPPPSPRRPPGRRPSLTSRRTRVWARTSRSSSSTRGMSTTSGSTVTRAPAARVRRPRLVHRRSHQEPGPRRERPTHPLPGAPCFQPQWWGGQRVPARRPVGPGPGHESHARHHQHRHWLPQDQRPAVRGVLETVVAAPRSPETQGGGDRRRRQRQVLRSLLPCSRQVCDRCRFPGQDRGTCPTSPTTSGPQTSTCSDEDT